VVHHQSLAFVLQCNSTNICKNVVTKFSTVGEQYHVSAFKQSLRLSTKGACFEVILEAITSFEMMLSSCPERNDRGRAPRASAQPQRVISVELSNKSFKYFPNICSETPQQLH